MKKVLPIFVAAAILGTFIYPIYAETNNTEPGRPPLLPKPQSALERLKSNLQGRIEEKKASVTARIDDRKVKVETKIEDRKDKIASREAFMKKYKDQKKAEVAARLEQNFNNVNQHSTTEMAKNLERLQEVLNKLSTRVSESTASSDLTVQSSITTAQNSIISAKEAITLQAAKTYSIATASEATVKTNAQSVKETLAKDLNATRKTVMIAKDSILTAYKQIAALLKKGPDGSARQ